jgi:cytidyltransferase-like protein
MEKNKYTTYIKMSQHNKHNVYISGVFDLFHIGHMKLIQHVRQQFPGCTLIAGVHNDIDTSSYKRIPIMTMEERINTLIISKLVDKIIPNAPLKETQEFYQKYQIDITAHAHSLDQHQDYKNKSCPEAGNKLVRLEYTQGISTSDIITRIKQRLKIEQKSSK